jgi:hypothetical protein
MRTRALAIVLAIVLMAGCNINANFATLEDYNLVVVDDSGMYLSGGTLRFDTYLEGNYSGPEVTSTSQTFSIKNIGTSQIRLIGSPKLAISDQILIRSGSTTLVSNLDGINQGFVINAQPLQDILDPGSTLEFIINFVHNSPSGNPGEALATLTIATKDDKDRQVNFAFELYGIVSC